jgi:hypothetical protein
MVHNIESDFHNASDSTEYWKQLKTTTVLSFGGEKPSSSESTRNGLEI